jgi:hypothetical protein
MLDGAGSFARLIHWADNGTEIRVMAESAQACTRQPPPESSANQNDGGDPMGGYIRS